MSVTTDTAFEEAVAFFERAFPPVALEALALVAQGISIITPDFRIVWANPALESWAGRLDAIRGRFCYETYQRRSEVCPDCPSARAFATGERASSIQPAFSHDGTPLWFEWTCGPVKNAGGVTGLVIEVATDITECRRTEEALRESEARYRDLFERLNDAVFVADPATGLLLDVNAAAERLVGYSREELVGMHQSRLHPPDQVEQYRERFQRHVVQRAATDFDAQIVRKDGTVVPVYISAATAEIGGRKVLQGIFRDITERKRMEEALRQRQRSLEASNARLAEMAEEMQQFLYLVSHDLRAPLVTIEGFASRLLTRHADHCPEEARHGLERIRAAVDSMANLIESLLRLSRAHTSPLKPSALDMDQLAAQVVRDLEQQATDAGVRVEIQPALPPAWGDPQAAYQVLLNLLTNAIKYRGDSDPRVWIGGRDRDEGAEFTVRDNGIGIAAEQLGTIFQMFTRGDTAGRPGLGIGLAGAKRLVERQGGRIWAESTPGQGSTFHFMLPRQETPHGQTPPAA